MCVCGGGLLPCVCACVKRDEVQTCVCVCVCAGWSVADAGEDYPEVKEAMRVLMSRQQCYFDGELACYVPSRQGRAVVEAGMAPKEGYEMFLCLQQAMELLVSE
eukprot:GHVU01156157.1.p1 GENE.GHVU01156157.1~~GHVU01156157.1.p1  ORF type:complete len:104 (+),score=17.69 GHVU01156157.1:63-374(+)